MAYVKLNGKYLKRDNKPIKIDASIDSNIIPENIRSTVEILGVRGTLDSSLAPTKSWLFITEYDSNGYPIKAKTIGCSGDMPYQYMYGSYNGSNYSDVLMKCLKEFEINKGVTSISNYAFTKSSLESIVIPDSVTTIKSYAFSECNSLTSIVIPGSVTSISNNAFEWCSSLTRITIGNGVTSIEANVFTKCTSLESITIPNSVTSIGSGAFSSCSNLTSITIPNSVISLGSSVFSKCTSLTSINIPDSVTSIGERAFFECSNLTSINIPDSVTSIGDEAFSGCRSLTDIIIPRSITTIGNNAFINCANCSLFDFRKATQVPTLANVNAFVNTMSTKEIVVPDSLYNTWITSTNWSSTANNIVSSIIKASDYEASL